LIRAWPSVEARVPHAKLVLVGEGDDRRRLEAKYDAVVGRAVAV